MRRKEKRFCNWGLVNRIHESFSLLVLHELLGDTACPGWGAIGEHRRTRLPVISHRSAKVFAAGPAPIARADAA